MGDDLFSGFGGGGSFMSQSSSTTYVNGKKVTTISMNKNGKQIQEKYENDRLIERKINGKKQNLDAIEGGDNKRDLSQEEDTKTRPNQYAHTAVYSVNFDLGWYGLIVMALIAACVYWCCCVNDSTDEHEHV